MNKQKAWRTQAAEVNKRRAAGSKEPSARVQSRTMIKRKPVASWLMQGLLIRAGLYDPLPPVPSRQVTPFVNHVGKSWFSKAWDKAKALFS